MSKHPPRVCAYISILIRSNVCLLGRQSGILCVPLCPHVLSSCPSPSQPQYHVYHAASVPTFMKRTVASPTSCRNHYFMLSFDIFDSILSKHACKHPYIHIYACMFAHTHTFVLPEGFTFINAPKIPRVFSHALALSDGNFSRTYMTSLHRHPWDKTG